MNVHDMTEQAYKNGFEAGKKEAQAEIERLQKENVELGKAISNEYELNKFLEATRKCVREEAVKEFWDKVVEKYESVNGQYVDRVMLGIAKDLVNEMTEQ